VALVLVSTSIYLLAVRGREMNRRRNAEKLNARPKYL
jgi:hypothetical protein